ncbi:uncharacterized protein A1O5_06772 [Cladophialophora psammophila CBS 110553]|uniref:Uncharacterized protein n=1 Tax=Cladophialophora psammophila CBS 110553 TaxID=1182543 RepID=W9WYF9_9EURO|nr:uncharacterized protein A1O5_06772 [Cladophialophora psammophila CBS 110553]EXJ69701.1 hypothetical protein A1O5_06772 [Cladophialophora psammophila CBS 110553]
MKLTAEIDKNNNHRMGALMHAIDYEHEEMVKMLLTRDDLDVNDDIDTEIRDGVGRTPLDRAIEGKNQLAIKALKNWRGDRDIEH